RTGLRSGERILPGKGSARSETGAAFSATSADCARQRPRYPASPAAKPRKVKDCSDGTRNAALRGTAWWGWQDSNLQSSDYEPLALRGARGGAPGADPIEPAPPAQAPSRLHRVDPCRR